MINVRSVTFSFGVTPVLDNINLSCEKGETIGIVGKSGIGKSTLLNLLCGYLSVQTGLIQIDGDTPGNAVRNQKVGYVFQSPTLLPWRNIIDNTILPLRLSKKTSVISFFKEFLFEENKEKSSQTLTVERALAHAHISNVDGKFPDELSGGMQTRASIARAIVYDPNVLLLDEPFSALDDIVKEHLYRDLQNVLSVLNTATVLVTHNLTEAVLLCDRVYVLNTVEGVAGSTITHCETIRLNKPRTLDLLGESEFVSARKKIREKLQ